MSLEHHACFLMQIEERKRLHAKLMQKVRERQIKPSEAADEMKAEVSTLALLQMLSINVKML